MTSKRSTNPSRPGDVLRKLADELLKKDAACDKPAATPKDASKDITKTAQAADTLAGAVSLVHLNNAIFG